MWNEKWQKNLFLLSLLLVIAVSRWWPWPANFSPVFALVLYSGTVVRPKFLAALIPILGILLSDLALGFYDGMGWVYVGYLFIVGAGIVFAPFRSNVRWGQWFLSGFVAALGFFVISNFGVWLEGRLYPWTAAGLWMCYASALPFFERSLAATWMFSAVLLLTTRFVVGTARESSVIR
jgi:hypothetical protein